MSVEYYDPSRRPDGRPVGPESLRDAVARIDGSLMDRARPTAAALLTWLSVGGPREKAHTKGVYVIEPTAPGRPRVLKVYVDSNAVVSDFRVNSEVYQVKLAHAGLEVDSVEFKLSRKVGRRGAAAQPAQNVSREAPPERTPPTPERVAEVDKMLENVASDRLRESLRRAMLA